ncbi:hypothetical protein [Bordetella sp. 02P26C-1]|uniref:hypothetical protein n=1 Tax=Bordetella sp. 02P26C-1 TaxID=2683195 RepID=UPI001365582E|nr:hypothetical protein [Bordetella sp. 02P26C-1]
MNKRIAMYRRRLSAGWMRCLWFVFAFVSVASVVLEARADDSDFSWRIPPGSTPALAPTSVRAFGIPIDVQAFHMPYPVIEALSHMRQQYPSLSQLPAKPEQGIQLAGQVQGRSALISLSPVGLRHTYGTFSLASLTTDAGDPSGALDVSLHDDTVPPIWIPRSASLTMHVEQRGHRDTRPGMQHVQTQRMINPQAINQPAVIQQVWRLTYPLQVAWRTINQGLRHNGWVQEISNDMAGYWRQDRQSLYVSLAEIEEGTAVYLQLTEETMP